MTEIFTRYDSQGNSPALFMGQRLRRMAPYQTNRCQRDPETMPPGSSEIRHLHRQAWQFFFVLRGEATLEVNQKVSVLKTDHGMEVLPGVPHQIFNKSEQELEILVISKPPSHGDRVVAP
jgi:mannose-6-phosphate isomerase-like protein (cupin superfamily)